MTTAFMRFLKEPVNLKSKKHLASMASVLIVAFILISIPLTVLLARKSEEMMKNPKAAGGDCISFAGQCIFVTSIDTMKLSKDMDTSNLSDAQIDAAVAASAALNPTHITVVTHYNYPDLMYRWVKSVRKFGKKVWFRDGISGWGNGSISPTQWLQTYQTFLQTYVGNPSYPNFFEKGDIFDPNAETENGYVVWCNCSIYNEPYKTNFNQFLIDQTTIADQVFAAKGFTQGATNATRDILTTVHSVDRGSAIGVLNSSFMAAMDNLVTADTYPDQSTTDAQTAANKWSNELSAISGAHPGAKILIGEMGYRINDGDPGDSVQQSVLCAEMAAFSTTTYPLVGMNYWVGPGWSGSGDYSYILVGSPSSGWTPRPGAACVSDFYKAKAGGTSTLSVTITSPTSGATVSGPDVAVSASVSLPVTKVEFYIDGSLKNTDTTSPYSFPWDTTGTDGPHTLSAKAYDAAGDVATSTPVSVTVDNAPKTYLWCEAEKASLVSPMVTGADTLASGGTYIYSTVTDSTNVPPTTTGSATLSFSVPVAGTYTFWSRTNYGSDLQNSYWLQFDGGTLYKVGNENSGYSSWKWIDWYDGDVSTANIVKVSLTAGTHTLKIIGREQNTKIDKFLLTTDAAYTPTGLGDADNCGGTTKKTADINGDGKVNIFDLSALLTRWGTNDVAADLNSNGIVDIFDLSILLSNWGS